MFHLYSPPSVQALNPAPKQVRLTSFTQGGGCGCKISPAMLSEILRRSAVAGGPTPAALLVGMETSDDAAVYQLSDEIAVVATTDFFTPVTTHF
jgi:selenide,water dikinase